MLSIWLVLGCGKESDVDRYYRLTTQSTDPVERIRECATLTSEAMQSDCQLSIAAASDQMATLCAAFTEPVWRSECYFLAAERLQPSDPAGAADLCRLAEHFRNECSQHLWQTELAMLSRHGSRSFPVMLPEAEALYARWSSVVTDESDMTIRFWRMFYSTGFQRTRGLQSSHCAPLPGVHQARCREAAAALYTQKLQSIARIPRAVGIFCALDPLTSAAAAESGVPELRAEPAAVLDAVVVTIHGKFCVEGQPREDLSEVEVLLPGFEGQ